MKTTIKKTSGSVLKTKEITLSPNVSTAKSLIHSQISIRFLVPMFLYLRQKQNGIAEHCLASFKLDETLFETENTIATEDFFQIIEYAANQLKAPCFGMHIYETLDFNCLGILGYALTSAATVGSALELLNRYYRLYHSGAELVTQIQGEQAVFSYRVLAPEIGYSPQDSENSLMFLIYLIRRLAQPTWKPDQAHFQHSQPPCVDEHKRLLCNTLVFNQPINQLIFDKTVLKLPIKNANAHLYQTLQCTLQQINTFYDESQTSITTKIRDEIVFSLPDVLPNIDDIAVKLHLGVRTLQRRLADEGYSFSQVLDKTRLSLASHYLSNTDINISEIAFLLGYSESNPFERAFKRWTQKTPREFRRSKNIDTSSLK